MNLTAWKTCYLQLLQLIKKVLFHFSSVSCLVLSSCLFVHILCLVTLNQFSLNFSFLVKVEKKPTESAIQFIAAVFRVWRKNKLNKNIGNVHLNSYKLRALK